MTLFNKTIIFFFFFIVFLIHTGQLLGINSVHDSVERRGFAKFPILNLEDPKLIDGLDAYFTDNFGFRNIFIKQYLFLKLNLLKTQNVFRNYFNSQGIKFGALSSEHDFKKYYQQVVFTQEALKDYKGIFEKEKKYLNSKNIPYFLVVIPDRRVIYNDLLPFTDKVSISRHKQFIDYIKTNTSIELIDVTDALIKARNKYPIFFKTDSHWTNYGAFITYTEIMKHLNKYVQIQPFAEEDFDITLEKYDIWIGDGGLNYPGHPGKPEQGVKFTPKDSAVANNKKLNSILVYGDSFLNFDRRVCMPCMLSEIPEVEPLVPLLFIKPSLNQLIDTNPGYWLPKDKLENLIPVVKRNIPDKKIQDYIINYLIKNSVFPDVVGLDYFFRLSFDKEVRGFDLTSKLDQNLIEQYQPDLVIREINDDRLWELSRVKCNYDRDENFNNINSC